MCIQPNVYDWQHARMLLSSASWLFPDLAVGSNAPTYPGYFTDVASPDKMQGLQR